jgi:hypothetical protein
LKKTIAILLFCNALWAARNQIGVEFPLPGTIDMFYQRENNRLYWGIKPGVFSSAILMTTHHSLNTISPSVYFGYFAYANEAWDIAPEARLGIGFWRQYDSSHPDFFSSKSIYGIVRGKVGYTLGRVKVSSGLGVGVYYFDNRWNSASSHYFEKNPFVTAALDLSAQAGVNF